MHDAGDAETLVVRLAQSGMDSRELEALLGVSQATVSRLRRGLIKRVRPYNIILDRVQGASSEELGLERSIDVLRERAASDPDLRRLIVDLARIVQNA